MKLKNRRQMGDTWKKRKFAIFPVQLGEFGNQGVLLRSTTRILWEFYYVEYKLCTGIFGPFTKVIRKYQHKSWFK